MLLFYSMKDKNIYIIGTIGSEGIKVIIQNKYEELLNYFNERFLNIILKKIENENQYIENIIQGKIIENIFETSHILKIGKGGILSSLWDLSKIENVGIEYSQKSIPLYQETIEICNFYDILPYRLWTKKRYVVFEDDEWFEKIKNKYNEMIVVCIGKTHKNKECFRVDSEVKSFLTKDYKDEIDKILANWTKENAI